MLAQKLDCSIFEVITRVLDMLTDSDNRLSKLLERDLPALVKGLPLEKLKSGGERKHAGDVQAQWGDGGWCVLQGGL